MPLVKNAFITEAETINVGAKFIIRDTAQQQVGQHREKWFVKTEARQRCTPGEKERVWVSPLVRRSVVKRWLSHLYRTVLPPSGQLFSTTDMSLEWAHTPQPRLISK